VCGDGYAGASQAVGIGFPIFGDSKYSKTQTSTRPWLHSSYLKFTHPIKAGPATGSSLEPLSATQRILEFKEDIDLNF
jgi:23S rRNA-/tRNA-specific pseudouridylate synthase